MGDADGAAAGPRLDLGKLKGWVTNLLTDVQAGMQQGKKSPPSSRWVGILLVLTVFFYHMARPFVSGKRTVYMDLRVGMLVWLFAAALLHTPFGSAEVEDHPSLLFASVFILLLVVTHMTLAAFTMMHHVFAWALGLCAPKLAETLWVPALRSMRSFKTILKSSILLAGSLSAVFAYCTTASREEACATQGILGAEVCAEGRSPGLLVDAADRVCRQVVPDLGRWGSVHTEDGTLSLSVLGFEIGRLSLLESPIGLLWMSGIALFATYYTLRRTKRINQTLEQAARDKRRKQRQQERREGHGEDEELEADEASDGEYEEDEDEELPAEQRFANVRGPARGARAKAPLNFLPMAEWYSLALTETAFQLLVSMKLFLGRFDMRTMQAAIDEHDSSDEEEGPDGDFADDASRSTSAASAPRRRPRPRRKGRARYDDRFAGMDELWFDWMADTGDGGNPTYAVARAVAQPELELRAPAGREREPQSGSDDDATAPKPAVPLGGKPGPPLERLKRGDLLLIGGDLAYPTPSRREYDQRLFVPFEYAMEPPPSYHRDDISTTSTAQTHALSSRLSFVRGGSFRRPDGAEALATTFSTPLQRPASSDEGTALPEGTAAPPSDEYPLKKKTHSAFFQIGSSVSLSSSQGGATSDEDKTASETEAADSAGADLAEARKTWTGPPCVFALPGNHDWFDGLDTYMQCICHRDWLGGWRMPQTKSYFALQLPHGWWLFGLDFALEDDIDGLQFQYFASIASKHVGENDQIILASHEPTWVLDAYLNHPHPEDAALSRSSKNLKQLMRRHLRGKVALRIAGDIHNYMRDDAEQPLKPSALRAGAAPVHVVAGGGGAFLHPTHTFPDRYKETGAFYRRQAAYPSVSQSRAVGMQNLGQGFRLQNWKFDIVGSTAYFLIVVSFFPRCKLDHILSAPVYPEGVQLFLLEVLAVFSELCTDSVVSLVVTLICFAVCVSFADYHYGTFRQLIIGGAHAACHVFCAITLFLLLEIGVEMSIRDGLAGTGYDSFFERFQAFERRNMPEAWWTSGIVLPTLRVVLRIFDIPENMATTRVRICTGQVDPPGIGQCPSDDMGTLTRFDLATYYGGNFLFLSVIAADIVAMVLGFYLFACVNFLHLHWNEAFSSVRSPDFKSFMRFRIDASGDLHAYAIGIDRVPRRWREDKRWSSTWTRLLTAHFNNREKDEIDELDPSIASYGAKHPSRWIPAYTRSRHQRRGQEPRIVDYFCIPKKRKWLRPRRGKSVVNQDWWEAFGDLERRKVFHKTHHLSFRRRRGSDEAIRRTESKSQSPAHRVMAANGPPALGRTNTDLGLETEVPARASP